MAYNKQSPMRQTAFNIATDANPEAAVQTPFGVGNMPRFGANANQTPINPRAFSNPNTISQMYGQANPGTFTRTVGQSPFRQAAIPSAPTIEVDPLTGQPMDPTASQSPTMPVAPSAGSPMSPLPPPNGVQLTTTPPLGM